MKRSRTVLCASVMTVTALLTASACGDDPVTTDQAPVASEPADEPMTDEPMTDEPMTDEPMTDEPMTDEPMTDEPADAAGAVDLDFAATTLDGEPFEGATLAGQPALLWFWAPWCPTCAGQAEHVSEVAETYAGQVNVVGVAGLDQEPAMRTFVEDRGVGNVVHLSDSSGEVWQRFGVTAQSTYVVLDADGVVVAQGVLSQGELDRALSDSVA